MSTSDASDASDDSRERPDDAADRDAASPSAGGRARPPKEAGSRGSSGESRRDRPDRPDRTSSGSRSSNGRGTSGDARSARPDSSSGRSRAGKAGSSSGTSRGPRSTGSTSQSGRPRTGSGRGSASGEGGNRSVPAQGRSSRGSTGRGPREGRPGAAQGTGPAGAPRRPRESDLPLPEGVTWLDLDPAVRADLRELPLSLAERLGGHLAAAGTLLDDDPELAYAHAREARQLMPRLGAVREALGLTAYACGRWEEAIRELRAARRLGGGGENLPLEADAERGLGRPDRALALAADPRVAALPAAARLEMLVVAAGARRDLGQPAAAVRLLDVAALHDDRPLPELARLRYAYGDALAACGRRDEARDWFVRCALLDVDHDTDAEERVAELDADAGQARPPAAEGPTG